MSLALLASNSKAAAHDSAAAAGAAVTVEKETILHNAPAPHLPQLAAECTLNRTTCGVARPLPPALALLHPVPLLQGHV